jgi:hypothetical protein
MELTSETPTQMPLHNWDKEKKLNILSVKKQFQIH